MRKKICALILAAGYSQRMGEPKLLLKLNGKTSLDRLSEAFFTAGIDDVFVVLGHRAAEIKAGCLYADRLRFIINEDYERGMFSSVKKGVAQLSDYEAFLLTPADYPLVEAADIRLLLKAANEQPSPVTYLTYQGKKGHPCLISSKLIGPITAEEQPQDGLKGLLQKYESGEIACDNPGILLDMDTKEDYLTIQKRLDQA